MTKLRVSMKYSSGVGYNLGDQDIDFIGLILTVVDRGGPTVYIGFTGRHVETSTGTTSQR